MDKRFWNKVDKDSQSPCWIYTGAKNGNGYGWLSRNGSQMTAHRWSWILQNGSIPKGAYVCHSCDNKICVNPDHLWVGTHDDNMKDMAKKGRGRKTNPRGEKHVNSILTEANVLEIRERHKAGEGYSALGREFGVNEATVRLAVKRRNWAWL